MGMFSVHTEASAPVPVPEVATPEGIGYDGTMTAADARAITEALTGMAFDDFIKEVSKDRIFYAEKETDDWLHPHGE